MCISIRICVEWLRLLDPEIVSAYRETVGEGDGEEREGEGGREEGREEKGEGQMRGAKPDHKC